MVYPEPLKASLHKPYTNTTIKKGTRHWLSCAAHFRIWVPTFRGSILRSFSESKIEAAGSSRTLVLIYLPNYIASTSRRSSVCNTHLRENPKSQVNNYSSASDMYRHDNTGDTLQMGGTEQGWCVMKLPCIKLWTHLLTYCSLTKLSVSQTTQCRIEKILIKNDFVRLLGEKRACPNFWLVPRN